MKVVKKSTDVERSDRRGMVQQLQEFRRKHSYIGKLDTRIRRKEHLCIQMGENERSTAFMKMCAII